MVWTSNPFEWPAGPVTNHDFAAFVEAGGYTRREWWSEEGWRWRESRGAKVPQYWRGATGRVDRAQVRHLAQLAVDEPVAHVCLARGARLLPER